MIFTFITIHELSPEARILYSSDSIIDVLGYSPEEVVNRSCWDYFHPDEVPIAKAKYYSGVQEDKAAVISYCRMRNREGDYVGCESVFTIVYDCMVGCTSIYSRGAKSQNRAIEAPVVRRLFSTDPRDPRYDMLEHLSAKFETPAKTSIHESRAALFLNRFTRGLTIMYATNGLAEELGIDGEELRGRSFYHCIQQDCLRDATRCLENAKANESIAYLRFWFRDPRQDDGTRRPRDETMMDIDDRSGFTREMRSESEDTDMGGVKIEDETPHSSRRTDFSLRDESSVESQAVSSDSSVEPIDSTSHRLSAQEHSDWRTSSGDSVDPQNTTEHIFGEAPEHQSSESSVSSSSLDERELTPVDRRPRNQPIELEAVVSCASDGLVVCLRRARGAVPLSDLKEQSMPRSPLFAVPWATDPMIPQQSVTVNGESQATAGVDQRDLHRPTLNGSNGQEYLDSIRDIAVFAWALTGINGTIAAYSTGKPRGEAIPAQGLPIWQSGPAKDRMDTFQMQHHPKEPHLPPSG